MDEKFLVIKDTREKKGWKFTPSKNCQGMIIKKLNEGDYSIQGYEDKVAIERKGSLAEFAGNLIEPRFYRELERLRAYPFSFIVLEFEMQDIFGWPFNSMPQSRARICKTTPHFLLKKISDIHLKYNTQIIFAGPCGFDAASSIFRQVVEFYANN